MILRVKDQMEESVSYIFSGNLNNTSQFILGLLGEEL